LQPHRPVSGQFQAVVQNSVARRELTRPPPRLRTPEEPSPRDAGALAYLVKPFQTSDLLPAIVTALGRFEQIVALERENADLAERLEARKMIDRAKGRLMDEHGLSEADSWRFLQKSAMNSRRKIHEVAADVVGGVLTP